MNCPSCGAALPVRSAAMPYVTCGHCQSLVLRDGTSAQDIGKVAVLPYDVSPVELGTVFSVEGRRLSTIGRVRWGWQDGSWNEWLLLAEDGTPHWLGEAMGFFMLTAERPDILELPLARTFVQGDEIAVGSTLSVDGIELAVTDVKQANCLGSEGDLPFSTLPGRSMTNIDFRGSGGQALSLQRDADGVTAWLGFWYDLAGLSPQGLRQLEGWMIPGDLQ